MKKKFLAFMLVIFMLACCSTAFAQTSLFEMVKIDYDRDSGFVEIKGSLKAKDDNSRVRLMVLKPGADIEKLTDGSESFVTWGVYAEETISNVGEFSFEKFKLLETSPIGDYIVRIAAEDEVYESVISHATKTQILDLLNAAKDSEEVLKLIELYNDVYLLPVSENDLFAKIGDEGKAYVLKKLCDGTFSDLDEVREEFNKHTALYKIYIGPWGSLEKVLTENEGILSLDMSDFVELSQSQKDKVCKALIGNLYEDEISLMDKIEDEIKAINKTTDSPSSRPSGSGSKGGNGTQVNLGSAEKKEPQKSEEENFKTQSNEEKQVFVDLASYDWAKESIYKLYKKSVVNGRDEKTFAPGDFVTRAEAVKMIIIALGMEEDDAECDFLDVEKNSWMYPYVAAAKKKNIVTGYSEDLFGAQDFITREDLVTVIVRALESKGKKLELKNEEIIFDDEDIISGYATAAVKKMQMAGVVVGNENSFYPKNNATRAETAKIIASIIE